MLVSMKSILDKAIKGKYGVGAYNVNNMEQVQAIVAAAAKTRSPLILQASRGALKYTNFTYIKHLMQAAVEENPKIPIATHLDHGDFGSAKAAIKLGFTSVMIDASLKADKKTPNSFEANVKETKKVVNYAHKRGISVEGELGTIGGAEEDVAAREIILADPGQAKEFVQKTGVDALAIAVGTSHGAYKFAKAPKLALNLVTEIRKLLPRTALVMHGSSSVPKELVNKINRYGGRMPNTKGVPISQIQQAIRRGINKVNVDTDSRLALTASIREVFKKKPDVFDPRHYLGPGRDAITALLIQKMKAFRTAGKA